MSNQLSLESRTAQGKKLKSLRTAGQIPSVIYGLETPILAASAYNATEKVLLEAGYHSPIDLDIAGKPQLAIVKRVDVDPVSRRIINVEFQAISADEVVEATTPIRVVDFGGSEADKLHYVLMQVIEEIDVKAKPSDLPKELVVSGAKLATLNDKITVADLELPAGVELVDKELDPSTPVANVYDPVAEAAAREAADKKAEEAKAAQAAGATTEPAADASAETSEAKAE